MKEMAFRQSANVKRQTANDNGAIDNRQLPMDKNLIHTQNPVPRTHSLLTTHYSVTSAFCDLSYFFLTSSSKIVFRIRIFLGVTSMHSSC
jgi:hypothetical protein